MPCRESNCSFIYVFGGGVHILSVSMIFQFDFVTVRTEWYNICFCFIYFIDMPCRYDLVVSILIPLTRLVIGTSRTVGSAKKFVRITSGFGGGEFTKTLPKVCTCQKLKFSFLLLEYCKIRECYPVANAFTIRNMHSLFLYMKCNSRKILHF
jgi:hypothetical protein